MFYYNNLTTLTGKVSMFKLLVLILITSFSLQAYESEDELKVILIGKISKYISYKDKINDNFIITVLKNPFGDLFTSTYQNKTIKSKPVLIKYIQNIKDLSETHILYIPKLKAKELSSVLKTCHKKSIVTISDSRGFAQRGGLIQLYSVSQKLKLKINIYEAKQQNIKIEHTLLRIADVVKGKKQ